MKPAEWDARNARANASMKHLNERQKEQVRELVKDLRAVETTHLTKRERLRSVRANLRCYIKSLTYKPYHDCWLEGR